MLDCILEAILDTAKILPYLFAAFLILELIEHKFTKKIQATLLKTRHLGPLLGGALGAVPQCGFSAMAAEFFSNRVITIGTLVAIFLSTSDEMLVIMLSENVSLGLIANIVIFKIIIGIVIGCALDLATQKSQPAKISPNITDFCDHTHCHCKSRGIWISSLTHTLKTSGFVLVANLLIGIAFCLISPETLATLLAPNVFHIYLIAALIGLIPNCASSVILTEFYISGALSLGALLAGLLPASGLGLLLLFKTNKNLKQNLSIIALLLIVGIFTGAIIDLF